jgi:hypothetical protein
MTMVINYEQEIAGLSQTLGLKLAVDWQAGPAHFVEALAYYLEYQFSLADGGLSLVTLGRGAAFLERVEAYLRQLKLEPAALETFISMRRYAGEATWGIKLPLSGEPEIQLYVKKPLPLAEVLFWLGRQGVSPEAAERLTAIAGQLRKDHTHFLGVDFTPGRAVPFQIYFTQYLDDETPVAERLGQVSDILGLPPAARSRLAQYHPLLAQPQETMWLSFSLVEGELLPTLKLDYSGVRLGLAAMLLEDMAASETAFTYLKIISETLGIDRANYMGLRLKGEAPPTLSFYFTRLSRTLP